MGRRRETVTTPATRVLEAAGVVFTVRSYDHDPGTTAYGAEAAAALGVDPSRVLKTLLVQADGELVVAVVPVAGQLDLKALAAAVGAKRAALAPAPVAERSTGYVVGGISPLGQRRRLRTVLDESAFDHATVLVSGGRRGVDLELAPGDLTAVTGAARAAVARA